MKEDPQEISGELYSECYEVSKVATREALKGYDLSGVNRDELVLETKKNKKSLTYKLFATDVFSKTLIATIKVNIETKASSVKVTNLNKI
ncbi:hypothetical protein [Reinekea sp.]|jgi:hypothetical protein|uniref:hypothetical protein n=1 Tax=Reinekea sp. TaxID=1970455 RepID=UPI003989B6C4